jgi:hypothetical protein
MKAVLRALRIAEKALDLQAQVHSLQTSLAGAVRLRSLLSGLLPKEEATANERAVMDNIVARVEQNIREANGPLDLERRQLKSALRYAIQRCLNGNGGEELGKDLADRFGKLIELDGSDG